MKYRSKSMDKRTQAEYMRLFLAVRKYGYNSLNTKDQAMFRTLYEMQNGREYEAPGSTILSKQKNGKQNYHLKMIKEHKK